LIIENRNRLLGLKNTENNQTFAKGFISLDLLNARDLNTYNQFIKREDIKIIKEVDKTVSGCYIDHNFYIPEQKIKFIIYTYLYIKKDENVEKDYPVNYSGDPSQVYLN
jgi:hypothetical protein